MISGNFKFKISDLRVETCRSQTNLKSKILKLKLLSGIVRASDYKYANKSSATPVIRTGQ